MGFHSRVHPIREHQPAPHMKPGIERHALMALNRAPWLFEIALGHGYQEDKSSCFNGSPTMCTDGYTIYYHPDVLSWPSEKIQGVLVHEWLHGGHHHMGRLLMIPESDAELWNIACDAVINPLCKAFGWSLDDGINIPWADGMTAEEVYRKLKGRGSKPKRTASKFTPGNMRSPKAKGQPSQDGKSEDANGDAMKAVEQDGMPALARMLSIAKSAGKLPGGAASIIERWTKPKVDWRAALREYCTRISRDGWSYDRTNNSYASMGLYVPGRRSKRLSDVVIVRDTSGSLADKQAEVASEAYSILSELRPDRLILIDCDAKSHRILELNPWDQMPKDALGGGGTDFRPAFKSVEENSYTPQVMVFITDLEGAFPDTPPPYPVVWATINTTARPPFGNTVEIEP